MSAALAATLLCMACGAAAPAPVKAPVREDDAVTGTTPGQRRRDLPPLAAPPPAYGNKIVMAQRNTTSSAH